MKKIMVLMFAAILSVGAFAQTPAAPPIQPVAPRQPMSKEERAKRATDNMKQQLNLTDDQYKKVYDLTLRREEITPGDTAAMHKYYRDHDAELRKILTPEQQTKMDDMRKSRGMHQWNAQPGQPAQPQTPPSAPVKK